jgi:hypothetical protein
VQSNIGTGFYNRQLVVRSPLQLRQYPYSYNFGPCTFELTTAKILSTPPKTSVTPLLQEKINGPADAVNTTPFKRELEKLSHYYRYQVFVSLGAFAKYREKQLLDS